MSNKPFPGVSDSTPSKECHHGESRQLQISWSLDNIQPFLNKHISEVCRKARQKVGILYRKCYKNANNATMLKLYLSCINIDIGCIYSNGFVVVLPRKPLEGYKWFWKLRGGRLHEVKITVQRGTPCKRPPPDFARVGCERHGRLFGEIR